MYRHIKDYSLRYTDVDAYDNLKLSALLSFLEESACLSADELGFGYKDVAPKNIGFIIVNWYVELKRSVRLGDKLTLHTWPVKPKHFIFLRDFELYVGNEKVGVASARWCMIDTNSFEMLPTTVYFSKNEIENFNVERSTDFTRWKIPEIAGGEKKYFKQISYSDYDHYFHANNTKYADFLMDVFSVGEIRDKFISSVQITYVKQCKEGEKLELIRACDEGYFLVEGHVDGELRVQMRLKLENV